LAIESLPQAIRAIKIVIGFTLLLIGIVLIVLPGPAMLVIPVALAILAGEFIWARRLLKKFNAHVKNLKKRRK
jgi:tellurite resistance protein TerC